MVLYRSDFFKIDFRASGYDWSELYATTYASGSQGNPLQWTQYAMICQYVKQVS